MVKEIDVDSHKLIYHPRRVAEYSEKGDCYPVYVEIGLTNVCNHKCIFCALDYLPNGGRFFSKEILVKTLKDMAEHGVKSVMFAGEGEPLLHKDIGLFVQKAKEYGMDVSITTNGIMLNEDKLKEVLPYLSWIRFSIDAGSAENYAKIHGTDKKDFEILMNNLKNAVIFRNENNLNVTIGAQLLLISENEDEAILLAKKLKEIKVDNIQIKPYSHHPKSLNDLSINPEKSRILKEEIEKLNDNNFRVYFRTKTINRINEGIDYPICYGLPFFSLIDVNGNLIPCNLYYGNDEFTYGNLNEKSFSEIWAGDKRIEVIKKLKEKGVGECRLGCRLDAVNRYLHRIKNPHPHDNFI